MKNWKYIAVNKKQVLSLQSVGAYCLSPFCCCDTGKHGFHTSSEILHLEQVSTFIFELQSPPKS